MKLLAALAAVLLASAPATAQNIATLPNAQPLTGGELLPGLQGTGCPTRTAPCASVNITAGQIGTYLGTTTFQPLDGDLTSLANAAAINALYYRAAANNWAPVTLGPNFSFSGASLTIPGLPITLSGDVSGASSSASGAIAVTLATVPISKGGTGATSSSAALIALGGQPIAPNLTAMAGLITAADNCAYWTGSAAAALYNCSSYGRSLLSSASAGAAQAALGLGSAATYAIGTSGSTVGLLSGNNTYGGAMTFSQVITGAVSGNAGTATALQTARTINGVSFNGTANITVAAVDTATPRLSAASNLSDLASASTARSNLGVSATGTDPNYCLLTGCTLTGTISGTTASFSAGLNVGTTTASQTATPVSVSLGGTYSNAAGANLKLKLLDVGSTTNGYGLGVSSNQLDYVVKDGAGASHAFWVNGTLGARIGAGGVTTGTVRLTTTSTVSNLGTCNASTQGTRTIVTDAASPSFLATLTGGGSVVAPAFCNGSAWVAG